jgi:phenylalanyl-tRNA synthetase beta chain
VSARLVDIRPYIGCAVVKDVQLTDTIIRQAMQLQDKLDQTYGRNRRRASIGLYNFNLIVPPLSYGVAKPDEVSFVPLDFAEKMTLREIVQRHPKGLEYGHIVKKHKVWPLLLDSKGNVLSLPPIINSNDLGRITEDTRNVLIEVTGTSHETVLNTLNMVVVSLADRGGKIQSAEIHYPYGRQKKVVTPKLETKTMKMDLESINEVLGFKLTLNELPDLLAKARYGLGKAQKNAFNVVIPCYRIDIMHPVDLIEDIAIAYGYNKIKPRWQRLPVSGGTTPKSEFSDLVREIMVGLGYQEVLNFIMTNPNNLQSKMRLKPEKVVEASNPRMTTLTCMRNWLLPSLFELLSHNTHVEYPQKIFEVGYAVVFNQKAETKTRDALKLACVSTHSNANFTEIKSSLEALLLNLGVKNFEIHEDKHSSFLEGRTAAVYVKRTHIGVLGEIHPQVLNNWQLKNPAAAFEIDVETLLQLKRETRT